ncbi:MAG TPA: hypothetical protein VJ986_05195 [Gaiellaceae bacterium]|nr:hypothetical protein [Gaiellaceae bacterium]
MLTASAVMGAAVALSGSAGSGAATGRTAATPPASTGLPTIVGSAVQGATVAASTGGWSGTTPFTFVYQWQRCDAGGASCADISSATAQTYTPSAADVGHTLTIVVTASNTAGTAQATSAATQAVVATAASAPFSTSPPSVSGTAQQGATLQTTSGSWNGAAPIAFAYRWQRCDPTGAACTPISGATDPTYPPATTDVGATLRVVVTASNSAGATMAVSVQTAAIAAASGPVNTALPAISGSPMVGQKLTADSGAWSGDSPITFSYRWLRCNSGGSSCSTISRATGKTYTLRSRDAGHTLRFRVKATNSAGAATVRSAATGVVASLTRPVSVSPPSISGTARQGDLLTVSRGTWSGSSPIAVAYRWRRCDTAGKHCSTIRNARNSTYRLTLSDVNHRLRVTATASNSRGRTSVTTRPTATIAPGVPQNTAKPTISGTARQGDTLTAATGHWNSSTPVTYLFQWTRCDAGGGSCAPISGHIGVGLNRYTLAAGDVGHRIFVQVKATNSVGSSWVNSALTAVVAAGTPPARTVGAAVPVGSVSLPARLLIDKQKFVPKRISSRSAPLVARFHVIETSGGRPVSGALVYAVGVPFGWLTRAGEVATDGNGWATLTFRPRAALPHKRGTFVVVFVRARKPGENVLGGVSNRKLVSVRIG